MDNPAARKLIRDTFQNPFDRGRYSYFIKNIFNRLDTSKNFINRGNYIPDAFKPYVHTLERIGKYEDPEGKKIDILIVHLKKQTSLEQARTRQRNFIAWYLNGSRGGVLKDAALVAFYTDNPDDWRFSLIKMDYRLTEIKSGKVRARQELTPARRFSFIVGLNENSHTAQTSLVKFLEDDCPHPTLNALEEAFSIEKVTKEFFEKYRSLFLELKEALENIVSRHEVVKKDFDSKGVDITNFAKKTLGQIVFLYFLQKKGWFGVARDNPWGTGPKNFLRLLFDGRKYGNFFNDILEPLFYEALARERDQDYYSRFDCKIPFLNGGLFDPLNDYDWVHADIMLPDELFSNDCKTKEGDTGTGILDVFDRYNFTVKEDEPLEREVAVDPEMLGKVFENLLEVKDRRSKGTYYTPREIVHYMCQESLINYLASELIGSYSDIFLRKEDIETFIRFGELTNENDARVEEKGKETKRYSYRLPESIRTRAALIDKKLAEIKVCDPAVGSGAFLVGMMNEIVKARQILTTYLGESKKRTPYHFKRHAIQNSLFGVDIDPGAVEIAKLRLWLSLIVDEEDIKQIRPLPKLDYKIMQGNSLLEEYEGIKLFNEKLIMDKPSDDSEQIKAELKRKQTDLQKEYFQLDAPSKLTKVKKQQLKVELEDIASRLKKLEKQEGRKEEDIPLFASEAKKIAEELKYLHKELFEASQKSRKEEIKNQIEAMEWELIEATLKEQGKTSSLKDLEQYKKNNTRPFFLWKLHFAEVFQEKAGFDVVIANPPYIRHEGIKSIKPQLAKAFGEFYCGTADIYTYFYKCGVDLLRTDGHLCFFSPNKFMRAGYGKNIRTFLTTKVTPKTIIDFGDLPIFDATTYPAILLVGKKRAGSEKAFAATFTEPSQLERVEETLDQIGFPISISSLKENGWNLESQEVQALMEKLRGVGVSLGKYVKGRFYYGIKTGLNEAFVIDDITRRRLIAGDPKSTELIKPWLRGRDIRKWKTEWAGLYVIFTRHGIEIEKYPAIKEYLLQFKKDLQPKRSDNQKSGRKPGPYRWFEIQDNIAYYKEFDRPKIIYPDITQSPKFAWDKSKAFLGNTVYFIPTDEVWLIGLLNSNLIWWYYQNISSTIRGGFVRFFAQYMETLPIPSVTNSEKAPIIKLVQIILADPDSPSVPQLETEINHLVYGLYSLTREEIEIIEGNGR